MKDVYWFRHDSNAQHDPKMIALRSEYGAEGYGVFWMFIETLRDMDGYKFPKKNLPSLSFGFATAKAEQILSYCVAQVDLLVEDDEFIWSPSLINRLEEWEKSRNSYADRGRKGGLAKAKAEQSYSTAKAKPQQNVAIREDKIRQEEEEGPLKALPPEKKKPGPLDWQTCENGHEYRGEACRQCVKDLWAQKRIDDAAAAKAKADDDDF